MVKLVISPLAQADMREIIDYISREFSNADAALRLMQRFKETMLPLREFPEMGSPLLVSGKQKNFLSLSCLRQLPDLLSCVSRFSLYRSCAVRATGLHGTAFRRSALRRLSNNRNGTLGG